MSATYLTLVKNRHLSALLTLLMLSACGDKKPSGENGQDDTAMNNDGDDSSGDDSPLDSYEEGAGVAGMMATGADTDTGADADDADDTTEVADEGADDETGDGATDKDATTTGSAGSGAEALHIVQEETFETRGAADEWEVDTSIGAHETLRSIRPPDLPAPGSALFNFECNTPHSVFTFSYWGEKPTDGQRLRLYVDDELYEAYGNTHWGMGSGWFDAAIMLPRGPHRYRFEAVNDVAGRSPFRLDSLSCHDHTPDDDADAGDAYDLDQGFIPESIGGSWLYNNDNAHSGDGPYAMSAQPPFLPAGGSASLEFNCDDSEHTQFGFYFLGDKPEAGQEIRLYVDDKPYHNYGNTLWRGSLDWYPALITLPRGKHRYRFEAVTPQAGRPPLRLDTFHCADIAPQPADNGVFDLDGGFVPPEVSGEWQINNERAHGSADLGFSAQPPPLPENGQATLTLDCTAKPHSRLRFWYLGYEPTADQPLHLSVDGVQHSSYGNTYWAKDLSWHEMIVDVPPGPHTYSWTAETVTASRPPYFLDSFHCE